MRVVELEHLARAVVQAQLDGGGGRACVHDRLAWRDNRAGCGRLRLIAHRAALAGEGSQRDGRRSICLRALVDAVHVDVRSSRCTLELPGNLAAIDVGEELRILGVVRAAQRPVVHCEAVAPEGDGVGGGLRGRGLVGTLHAPLARRTVGGKATATAQGVEGATWLALGVVLIDGSRAELVACAAHELARVEDLLATATAVLALSAGVVGLALLLLLLVLHVA
mmetsp:Transcript_26659/g.78471  ORF Transcript_26659/g.78471 Transcript_26659/m.78471 type:complete len:223 (-) Transcript_26659:40-708(-)